MSKDAPSYPADVTTCHEMLHSLSNTVAEQARQIEQLQQFVAVLKRQQFGPRRERVDPNQLALFDTSAEKDGNADNNDTPPSETQVRAHRRRGGGRMKLPKDLPRETVEHDLSDEEKACPGCGEARVRIGSEVSEQLEFVPAVLKVIEHVRHKYACRTCQEHVERAAAPPRPIAKGLAGPGLLAALAVGKYGDHLPLYRLEDVLARAGVEISRGTLARWAAESARLLEPLYELMVRRVLASPAIHTDDTTVPVLDRRLPHCRTARFWTYAAEWPLRLTVFDYTETRSRDGPEKFLRGYRGFLQADAFAGYDGIYAGGVVTQVLCWAHARRKFYEARTSQPKAAHAALAYIARLYAVERAARELATREEWKLDEAASHERWRAARFELRQQRSLPILAEFYDWLEATSRSSSVLPKSPVGVAIRYVLPRWQAFTRYCSDGQLAIDNNLAERALRPCAIGRKNWTFLGSDNGGRTAAILYSFTASAKAIHLDPQAYLRHLFAELPAQPPGTDLAEYLPQHHLAQHPESHRPTSR